MAQTGKLQTEGNLANMISKERAPPPEQIVSDVRGSGSSLGRITHKGSTSQHHTQGTSNESSERLPSLKQSITSEQTASSNAIDERSPLEAPESRLNEGTRDLEEHTDNTSCNGSAPDGDNSLSAIKSEASERPYSAFSNTAKFIIVLVATLGGCFSPFTANIYFPAISTISRDLRVSITQVNLTITTYMIFQGIAPSFISAIADERGRRPAYMIGFTLYMAANLGLALNNTYAGLLVLRCLQSCGSSGLVTMMQGTIADVVTSAERGKYISITSLASILGPSIAPIAGGLLAQHLGWRSIFWFLFIMSGIYFIPMALFFPETCRNIVGDGSIPPQKWNRCLLNIIRKSKTDTVEEGDELKRVPTEVRRPKSWKAINPLRTLKIIADPETGMILLYIGLIYGGFYAITTSITVQFEAIYHLDSTFQGLLFLTQAVGSILAAMTNVRLLDYNYRRHAIKAGLPTDKKKQVNMLQMPIERARLEIAIPVFALVGILIVIYGWLLQLHVHIAGPLVILVFTAYGIMIGFNTCSVLVIDLHRKTSATASAANNLVRCLLGAGATAVVNPAIEALGNGWTFTIVGVMYVAILPLLWYPMMHGFDMRQKRHESQQNKDQKLTSKSGKADSS